MFPYIILGPKQPQNQHVRLNKTHAMQSAATEWNAGRQEHMQAVQVQVHLQLLLTDLGLLEIVGVPGIQQSGGRRATGELGAMVRVLQLPATKQNDK